MINFHGANKPTGEARTWPHEITREGIREQEYVLWGSLPLTHYGALPFTAHGRRSRGFPARLRPAAVLEEHYHHLSDGLGDRLSSPFLCWPDNPEAYLNSPLLHFVRTVPVTWDETRVLPGSAIGDTVIMARRKEAAWYVAALNCRSEPRTLDVDLSSLDLAGKEWTVYRDGPSDTACHIEAGVKPPSGGQPSTLSTALRPGGGVVVVIAPPKQHSGWK